MNDEETKKDEKETNQKEPNQRISERQLETLKEHFSEEDVTLIKSAIFAKRVEFLSDVEEAKRINGYDLNNPYHVFCWEIQESLKNYINAVPNQIKDENGNWFGRLVAFKYEIDFLGTHYKEYKTYDGRIIDEFRDEIRKGNIKIKDFITHFSSIQIKPDYAFYNGLIEVNVTIVDENDNRHDYTMHYTFEHRLVASLILRA